MPSSQFPLFLGRMLWKEYRAQRSLWLVVGGVMLIAQIMARVVLRDDGIVDLDIWFLAGLGPWLFTVGAIAIVFAGEREARTSEWLHQLAAPPAWLLAAKWGSVIVASQALVFVLSISAMVLTGTTAILATLVSTWALGAGVLLWGSLGSLITRRVVTSIPAMAACWIVLMLLPTLAILRILPSLSQRSSLLVVLVPLIVATGAIDIWLGWRWCQGMYIDGRTIERLAAGLMHHIGQRSSRTKLILQIENPYGWQRTWQRLVWQERHRESYHRMLLGGGGLAAILLTATGLQLECLCLIATAPLLLGILAFRYEGEGQPLRFLANRGLSPAGVWFAKQFVWVPRSFLIPAALVVLVPATELISSSRATFDLWSRPADSIWTTGLSVLATVKTVVECGLVIDVLWLIPLGFAAGQLSAMLLRKTAMALVVGVLLNVLFAAWLAAMVTIDVPRWWSVGGPVVWIWGLTFWYSPYWLTERQSPGITSRLVMFLVLPPMALIGSVGTWRAVEIAGFGPQSHALFAVSCPWEFAILESRAALDRRQSIADGLKQEIDRQSWPEAPDVHEPLQRSLGGFNTVREFIFNDARDRIEEPLTQEIVAAARNRFWAENERRLANILEFVRQESVSSPRRWQEPANSIPLGVAPVQTLLAEAARLRTEEGRLPEAFQFHMAGLRLARFWGTRVGVQTWWEAKTDQQWILQNILEWANHPDQTSSSLREARRALAIELKSFPTVHAALIAEYREESTQLAESIRHGNLPPVTAEGILGYWRQNLADGCRLLPWEQVRAHRMLEQALLHQIQAEMRSTVWLNQPGVDAARSIDEFMSTSMWKADEQFWQSTPLLPERNAFRSVKYSMVERETLVRESLLALSLLEWKREHARWPDQLSELLNADAKDRLPAMTLVDPWSGELFRYRGNRDDDVELGRNSLLGSVGPSQLRFVFVDDSQQGIRSVNGGARIAPRDWRGHRFEQRDDDRLQLEMVDGRLSLLLPYVKKTVR
ncbi:MAG: hypothetical protein JSS49_27580 [Planctomycetes bacterium]|nr:hypothetical protein [Planctomycetota bacterium]